MADFSRNETIRDADFSSTPYRVAESSEPLFASPLLITEVNIAPLANGALRLQCAEKLSEGPPPRSFELVLSSTLTPCLHALDGTCGRGVAMARRGSGASQCRRHGCSEAGTRLLELISASEDRGQLRRRISCAPGSRWAC